MLSFRGAFGSASRQGTFVSAVTHELRTPLTTFRLYTEMLDEGMVADPAAQHQYVKTLRAEADRLGHLVENVLAYRASSGAARPMAARSSRPPSCSIGWFRSSPFAPGKRGSNWSSWTSADVDATVRVNVSIVDQILSNLVDNALKYAGKAEDRANSSERDPRRAMAHC